MPMCFDAECSHQSLRDTCKLYRFPKDVKERLKWKIVERRRLDRAPDYANDRVCSCHFLDGKKENGPTIFNSNKDKAFNYVDPEQPAPKKRKKCPEAAGSAAALELTSSTDDTTCRDDSNGLTPVDEKDHEIAQLKRTVAQLQHQLSSFRPTFGFENLKNDDDLMKFYTGLPGLAEFNFLNNVIGRVEINYFCGWSVKTLSSQDQLLMTLMKLRHGFAHLDLATRFNVKQSTVTNVVNTFIHVLHDLLFKQMMHSIPSRTKNQQSLPACFAAFKNTRITIDCTEVGIEIPQSMYKQNLTYSRYKGKNTFKGLVGVAPNGTITFLSCLYPGSTSDKEIVRNSNVLQHMQPGDLVLADKGFLIHDLLPAGVSLNIPPFLHGPQFTQQQVLMTREIARARIHVERAIQRLKTFKILDLIPVHLRPYASVIFQVCGALTLLQRPIISEVSSSFSQQT